MVIDLFDAFGRDGEKEGGTATELVPLDQFHSPPEPAEHLLRRSVSWVRRVLGQNAGPFVEADELDQATAEERSNHMAQPTCRPVVKMLDKAFEEWSDNDEANRIKLVVMPPGDNGTTVTQWAEERGLVSLDPPPNRLSLIDSEWHPPELEGDGVLVIPMLERWYLRHDCAIGGTRELLEHLARSERRVLVICNMWAWRCFKHTLDARSFLPAPLTLPAFDARALRQWLIAVTEADGTSEVTIKEASSGEDVLALDSDQEFVSSWLPGLAARSFGIPWVAWALWKSALRTRKEGDDDEAVAEAAAEGEATGEAKGDAKGAAKGDAKGDSLSEKVDAEDEDTLWMAPLPEVELPEQLDKPALLLLHSVLLHGGLALDELTATLPGIEAVPLLHALKRSHVIESINDRYVVTARRYPEVHAALESAGLDMLAS